MLRLERLNISGFKSFPDPVVTEFAEGITAIVGPNGCGKSNLSEAVTWVLGEQSAKSLRGGKMEDVIFTGSERRKALGMAEVSLTLRTLNGHQQADEQGRITVGRRVFRSGESQYRLNDKVVRLREIRDLLMDTGLGVRAYSVIEQGRIGMILSGKPQDRRKLIEEAAGITRYKARKHVAELRLEEATANLLRLNDIISEVERALRSLKRQAGAARRYKEREAAYRDLLEQVLVGRWAELHHALAQLEAAVGAAQDREAEVAAQLARSEATLAAARQHLDELGSELARRHQHHAELAALIEGRQEFVRAARTTLQELGERLASGAALAEQRRLELAACRQALGGLSARSSSLLSDRDSAAVAVAEDQRRLDDAVERVKAAEARLESLRSQLMSSLNRVNALQSRLHQHQIETEKGQYREDHLRGQREGAAAELEDAASTAEAAQARFDELEARRAQHQGQRDSAFAELEATLAGEAQTEEQRRLLADQITQRANRQSLLEELEHVQQERRARLREALADLGLDHLRFLDDQVQVPRGWEGSLDLYLEQLNDAILVPPDEDALALARALASSDSSGTLLQAASEGEIAQLEPPTDPAIRDSLGKALGLPAELSMALPPAYLVDRPQDAERLARQHPGCAFISRDRLWAQSGALHLQGRRAAPGTLGRQRELEEIAAALPQLKQKLAATERTRDELVGKRTRLAGDVNRLDSALADLRQELAVASARLHDTGARLERLRLDRDRLEKAQSELRAELDRLALRRDELHAELETARRAHASLEQELDAAQRSVAEAREAREGLKAEGAGRRGRLELLVERVESHDSEIGRLDRQSAEISSFLERWAEEERVLVERRAALEGQIATAGGELQRALERRVGAEEDTLQGQEQLDRQRSEVARLAQAVEEVRSAREHERERVQELRLEQAAKRQDAEHLSQSFRDSFGCELPADPGPPLADLAGLERELLEHKAAIERLGPVNVLAAEEFTEQEERYRFLTEQRLDVKQSVESLKRTIREINQTSTERFLVTFAAVNEQFAGTFRELFRGGEATMRIMDDEDPLEAGIEIIARPPGKRLQNINLLSGGEKALTAIALLFALFRTKPSPFCILDEVDAPLDDANVLRFVHMLRGMATQTQILIITHNKITMEAASTLYGVTMEEKGVSRLVGVQVDEIHPESALVAG